jgi:hypothetical protein
VSFLDAVTVRLRSDEATGAAALLRHVRLFPRDALAVSVTVPTVAFGGLTSGRQTAQLVEGLGRSYGDDWWYAGQLAFVRQDQERWAEAESLAAYALSVEPSSGHAAHARTHVFYETGQHADGLAWLDGWIRSRGPEANHRSHFSWHAGTARADAVRRRRRSDAATSASWPAVGDRLRSAGRQRALLLALPRHRHLGGSPAEPGRCASAPDGWLLNRRRPFAAMHSALGLAASRATTASRRCAPSRTPTTTRPSDDVVRRCAGRSSRSSRALRRRGRAPHRLLPRTGSARRQRAQREVLEDTLVYALARSGQGERAAEVLDQRLTRRTLPARRPSPCALAPPLGVPTRTAASGG